MECECDKNGLFSASAAIVVLLNHRVIIEKMLGREDILYRTTRALLIDHSIA